jgi:hypothetical protein
VQGPHPRGALTRSGRLPDIKKVVEWWKRALSLKSSM